MKAIDLKKEERFIGQYVALRNRYPDLLLASRVSEDETKQWLRTSDIEARGLVEGDVLVGAVVLYLQKDNEVAFFAKERGRGIGTRLLNVIEEVASAKGLKSIRAWALSDNAIAQRVFEKCGFLREGVSERKYKGLTKQGIKYIKYISERQDGEREICNRA